MSARPTPTPRQAGYPVRAVADRLGIPTATLRSWNRRYGIGPRQDRPGLHRLYTEADIAVLGRMLELIAAGASPAGAAAAARGPAVSLGDEDALLAAAFALDTPAVCDLLAHHVRIYGIIATWDRLCRPAFARIVARQLDGDGCVDVEHLLSWCIISTLHRTTPPLPVRAGAPLVLACTSGETHSLPLEVLRAALAEHGTGAQMLGADVPATALADTLARDRGTATVVLWSQQEATALSSAVRACAEAGAHVYVGGPGWDGLILPQPAIRLATLTDAVARLSAPGNS
ncbi:MerR family transcriptional regulator [Nocardia yunnanensis]|uniref:MerR family transcriptional regulator n=1 Tax=Nocardia yunnanensis TaxID=2382165 RepID=A0A386ZN19_9NOCA|nr:MerR family transcriptional regulator [Nocardia yunnanensis]AYF78838.1 MerR family transcriptional regulator [Nocardia yunnanensis]